MSNLKKGSIMSYNNYNFDKNINFSNILNKSAGAWLNNKIKVDDAEGLWRIHDSLYDVTDFINVHPGGKFWLEETRGSDATELFESHHISDKPERMLQHFYVRKAKSPRASTLTFAENGFYRTVKKRVREVLKATPKKYQKRSKFYTDCIVFAAFFTACLANYTSMFTIALFAAILSSLSLNSAHNYIHMKDNWRMYYADVFLFPSRDARIFHVLSHHMYTNSVADIQFNVLAPFNNLFPVSKHFITKYMSWLYIPLVIWPMFFYIVQIFSTLEYLVTGIKRGKVALLTFAVPFAMYLFGQQSLWTTLLMWQFIVVFHGITFSCFALALNHAHLDVFVEGDLTRPQEQLDWGIIQLDSTHDRIEATGNEFLALVTFGHHGMHHLFPTVDHGVLHLLVPVVEATLKEFHIGGIRMTSYGDLFKGYFKRMANEIPNLNPVKLGYVNE